MCPDALHRRASPMHSLGVTGGDASLNELAFRFWPRAVWMSQVAKPLRPSGETFSRLSRSSSRRRGLARLAILIRRDFNEAVVNLVANACYSLRKRRPSGRATETRRKATCRGCECCPTTGNFRHQVAGGLVGSTTAIVPIPEDIMPRILFASGLASRHADVRASGAGLGHKDAPPAGPKWLEAWRSSRWP